MERGPVALFGAIVAVGLGPALWLGAQFGKFDVTPTGPPVPVSRTHDTTTQLMGGSGAGGADETGDESTTVRTKPRAHVMPLTASRSASPAPRPSDSSPSVPASAGPSDPAASDTPTASPSPSTDPSDGDGGGTGTGAGSSASPAPSDGSGGSGGGNGDPGGPTDGGGLIAVNGVLARV